MTSAATPSSRTRTFDPPPRILNGICSSRQRRMQPEQLVERPGPGQERGRAPQAEPDVRGQRLIGLDDRAEVVE